MSNDYATAIEALERSLKQVERKANDIRSAINTLCEEAGLEPKYSNTGRTPEQEAVDTRIRPDTFYGKKQSTAMRMYLDMRKTQGIGPATPREIFEALKLGGYQFETKNETTALIGMRALLRKNTTTFHRLPNGSYGLLSWYPDAKAAKPDEVDEEEAEAAASSKQAAASELRKARSPRKRGRPPKTPERKEEPDVVHRPDLSGPMKAAGAA